MPPLLLLCHRIPYPPNKGDKVRSYHLLSHLAEHYAVFLGAFVDDSDDLGHGSVLEQWCAELRLEPLRARRATIASARGLLTGEALTLPYYRSRAMGSWVDDVLARTGCRRIVVFSSCMGQYVLAHLGPGVRSVLDLVDVDSDKWRQYGIARPWPWSWIYRRESERLLAFERRLAAAFDHTVLVSAEEVALFRRLAPEVADRVVHVSNGVDTEFFDPDAVPDSPYPAGTRAVVFTGAMDYWANVDAVVWFADAVWPKVRSAESGAVFYVVGSRPASQVQALSQRPGVVVTGTVDDVRPWIGHAEVCVAPLRIARGVQNKVLEAMAMGRPVVATPEAVEGIEAGHGLDDLMAADADAMAAQVLRVLRRDAGAARGTAHRRFAMERYAWGANLGSIRTLLEAEVRAGRVSAAGASRVGDAA